MFKKAITDLENKYVSEINNLKNSHQLELDYKGKEITLIKNENEMYKSFEKEYIKIIRHDEIINNIKEEMNIKYSKELKAKENELDLILKSKITKIEEEKKIEYEFVNENLRKTIKKLEQSYEDLSNQLADTEQKLNRERENNEKYLELNENLKKNIKLLTNQIEEDQKSLSIMTEKISLYEVKLNNITNSNYNYQENLNNLHNKLSYLEGEKMVLNENLRSKEEAYKKDLESLERKFSDYKDTNNQKFTEECSNHEKTKKMLFDLENSFKEFQNEFSDLSNKNNELLQKIAVFEELTQNLNYKSKNYEAENENLERKWKDNEKKYKRAIYDSKSFNELLIKIFKTKLASIKSDVNHLKNVSLNEINSVKKEYSRKIEESLIPKIKLFFINIEKQNELKIKLTKDTLIKEFEKKGNERDEEFRSQLDQLTNKYEKKVSDLLKQSEKLQEELTDLVNIYILIQDGQYQSQLSINRENAYRIQEYEQEVKKMQILNNNLQSENNNLSNIIEKVNQDKKYITKLKEESEEVEEKKNRELVQKYQGSLSKILQNITKIKNKYQQEILILKNEVENMNIGFESK